MLDPSLRIYHYLPASRANGPGLRAVLWFQGCTLACPGCFNPGTHLVGGGTVLPVSAVFEKIISGGEPIEGLTLSGGEPLQQLPALLALLELVRSQTGLSVLVFTGFTWAEIQKLPAASQLLGLLDVLIAGRYQQDQRLARGLLGSANKSTHFLTPRYKASDLASVPPAEVLITPSGEVIVSGIDPLSS